MLLTHPVEVKVELFVAGIGLITERREVHMTDNIPDITIALGILVSKTLEHVLRERAEEARLMAEKNKGQDAHHG